MGDEMRRGTPFMAIAVSILIIILLHAHIFRAAMPPPVGGNSSASGGGGEWLVGDVAAVAAEEFLMDSEIHRRMLGGKIPYSYNANNNRKEQAVSCGQGRNSRYTSCLPARGGGNRNPKCDFHNRECK